MLVSLPLFRSNLTEKRATKVRQVMFSVCPKRKIELDQEKNKERERERVEILAGKLIKLRRQRQELGVEKKLGPSEDRFGLCLLFSNNYS